MPTAVDIIDAISTPPLAALQQVLDTNGPFHAGHHTLTNFHTSGAFILPAGTYDVGGTYGVMAVFNGGIPAARGFSQGWISNDGNSDESIYEQPFAQVVIQHQLPITGAWVTTEVHWMTTTRQLIYWTLNIGSPGRVGLYVAPDVPGIDLYYLCVL